MNVPTTMNAIVFWMLPRAPRRNPKMIT